MTVFLACTGVWTIIRGVVTSIGTVTPQLPIRADLFAASMATFSGPIRSFPITYGLSIHQQMDKEEHRARW